MKRFCIIAVMLMAVGSASAQKKEVATLQQQVAALTNTIDSLKLIIKNDKLAIKALETSNLQIEASNKQIIKELEASNKQMSEKLDAVIAAYNQSTALVTNLTQQVTELNKLANERLATEPTPTKTSKAKYEIVTQKGPYCRMIMVREGALYGFINSDNEYIIKAQYEEAEEFKNGYARVKKNGKWGVVNTKGKEVIACNYDMITFSSSFRWIVRKNNLYGIVSSLNGKEIVACNYDELKYWSEYCYRVRKGNLYGLLSAQNGAIVQAVKYKSINKEDEYQDRWSMCINGKYGYFNKKGEVVIPAQFDSARGTNTCELGVFLYVDKGSKQYLIDKNGKIKASRNDWGDEWTIAR